MNLVRRWTSFHHEAVSAGPSFLDDVEATPVQVVPDTGDEGSLVELQHFEADNERYRTWWRTLVAELEAALPQTRGSWRLTGSRAFGLAYPESDTEGALLCAELEQAEAQASISSYLVERGLEHDTTVTSAGLRMLVLRDVHHDDGVAIWQLELTLRTPQVHATICAHIDHQLASWSRQQRTEYIRNQRHDLLAKSSDPEADERYNARKAWLKVLPPQAPRQPTRPD